MNDQITNAEIDYDEQFEEFETYLYGKLDGISLTNLKLRQKTAAGYIERLVKGRKRYPKGSPEWIELKEWRVREKVYKALVKEAKAQERELKNKIKEQKLMLDLQKKSRMGLPDTVPTYDPSIHNYTLEQHQKVQALITGFKAKMSNHYYGKPVTFMYRDFYHDLEEIFGFKECEVIIREGFMLRFKYYDELVSVCHSCQARFVPTHRAWIFETDSQLDTALKHMNKLFVASGFGMKVLNLETLTLT